MMIELNEKTLDNYSEVKASLMLNSSKKFTNKHAYITHYLHNSVNGTSKFYKNEAIRLLNEISPLINVNTKIINESFFDVPFPPVKNFKFTFIDLFAGIGGFRLALQNLGGKCVFSSEINDAAKHTYEQNFGEIPFGDIREFSGPNITDEELNNLIPDHNVLTAGFPCQPFSLAGVSARKFLGQHHGFSDQDKGNLFFDIARIVQVKKPDIVFLENVKNFKGHDKGNTYLTVKKTMEELGYSFFSEVINADRLVPQSRQRFYMVCFKNKIETFKFPKLDGDKKILRDILEVNVREEYTISDRLWEGHINRTIRNLERGTGFTANLANLDMPSKTLVARYGKDGKECLIPQDGMNPRKLTPRECARLQGFPEEFILPSSNAAAYHQFGNSVAVPVIQSIAKEFLVHLDNYKK